MTEPLSKIEIGTRQLSTAIDLYLQNGDLVSVVTLAGAADEILGKLVKLQAENSALDDLVDRLCKMHEAVFQETVNPKKFAELRNRARNEFKHISSGVPFGTNLEQEARSMIRRAIENYRKLRPGFVEKFRELEVEMVRRAQQ